MNAVECGFPAWVFDDMLDSDLLDKVVAEFPAGVDPRWQTFRGGHEAMKQQGGPACWGPATTALMVTLMSPSTVQWVQALTGIDHLAADVVGGGMHQSGPGAHLDTHVDFDRHPQTGWRRAVNFLIYLNRGWQEEWGGLLELGETPVTVVPEFNRTVVFRCSDHSWHGHPQPVAPGHVRRSIACYFYDSDDLPQGPGHSTVWKDEAWPTPTTS